MRSESHRFQAYRGTEPPRFANRIELECARILDWYGVAWEYEPTSFVLERDDEGRITRAFTPDFYLPDENLYIEVTVMKQSLVTRKNRKLRELPRAVPARQRQALLPARSRAPRPAIPTEARIIGHDPSERSYLSAAEIAARVGELGAAIAADYDGREPAARGAAEVERRLPRRSLAGDPDPAHDRPDRARGLLRRRPWRRPPAQGSRHSRSRGAT